MLPLVNRLIGPTCALLSMMVAAPVWSAPSRQELEQREREAGLFAVGLAITSSFLINEHGGSIAPYFDVESFPPCFLFPFCNAANPVSPVIEPAPFGASVSGTTNTISPSVGASLELMTPALDLIPGDPRFFATAEILPTFAGQKTVALEGVATEFLLPEQNVDTYQTAAIGGTGSRLTSEVMTTVIAANVGVAFGFDVRDRLVRVKPSVGWIRWGVVVESRILEAYKDDPVLRQLQDPFYGSNIRLVEIGARAAAFFNAVGPGLEVEMELGRRGPFRPVIFAGGFAYRTVGDDSIVLRSRAEYDDALGQASYGANATFQVEEWSYRAAIGFRLRWTGD